MFPLLHLLWESYVIEPTTDGSPEPEPAFIIEGRQVAGRSNNSFFLMISDFLSQLEVQSVQVFDRLGIIMLAIFKILEDVVSL